MPITRRHDPELDLLVIEMTGELPDSEVLDFAHASIRSREAPQASRELLDLRGLETVFATDTLAELARIYAGADNQPERVRVAIVVANSLFFGVARQYQTYRSFDSAIQIRIFMDIAEASAWLGLPG